MLSTGAAPPAVQLAITLLLCLVPTLALFGLLRLLSWLRDDELVARMAAETDEPLESAPIDEFLANGTGETSSSVSSGESGSDRSPSAAAQPGTQSAQSATTRTAGGTNDAGVRCRHCGAPNPEDVRYCEQCVGRL